MMHGSLHNCGANGRCTGCGEAWPCSTDEDVLATIKPRRRDPNPRCSACASPDPKGRAPMVHPAHRWGPCAVELPGGEPCGCTVGVQHPRRRLTSRLDLDPPG
jgi:hypothetical protein